MDEWFPTVVRYLGLLLTGVLVVANILGHTDYPAAYVAAAGLILYKTVRSAVAEPDEPEAPAERPVTVEPSDSLNKEDRWSHLP
jgi:hypothetical protein